MTYKAFDAAEPPAAAPPGMDAAMGYIGGAATHVWTPAEWQPFSHLRQYPIWVREGFNPAGEGHAAVAAAVKLGWAAHLPEGENRVIIVDMETFVSAEWYDAIAAVIIEGGFTPVCYGSMSTVFENEAEAVFAADWDGTAAIPAGQTLHGLQYDADMPFARTVVDYSVVDSWLIARGGLGARHGA